MYCFRNVGSCLLAGVLASTPGVQGKGGQSMEGHQWGFVDQAWKAVSQPKGLGDAVQLCAHRKPVSTTPALAWSWWSCFVLNGYYPLSWVVSGDQILSQIWAKRKARVCDRGHQSWVDLRDL